MQDASSGDDDLTASINVTPFVDVVLVLLVIFMVTSNFVRPSAIDVKLPRAQSGGAVVAHTLNLVLDAAGKLRVDGQPKSEGELRQILRNGGKDGERPQVVIAADRGVDYGAVIHLIDLVKAHGIDDFALEIDRG